MKRICFFLLMAAVSQQVLAQLVKPKPHTLELANGGNITGELLVYAEPILSEPIFQMGDECVPAEEVRFFRNSHGYFANLNFADKPTSSYAMRIKKGKVDLFEEIDIDFYGKSEIELSADQESVALKKLAQGKHFQYFSIDGKSVKRANYNNLKLALASNQESVGHMKSFNKYQWLQRGLVLAGSSLLVGGFAAQGDSPKFTPVMALGIVLGGTSFFCNTPKDDFLWMAVEAYNGN